MSRTETETETGIETDIKTGVVETIKVELPQ
jgi:hypothetical protein